MVSIKIIMRITTSTLITNEIKEVLELVLVMNIIWYAV